MVENSDVLAAIAGDWINNPRGNPPGHPLHGRIVSFEFSILDEVVMLMDGILQRGCHL
jgi:hypothetical protein